MRRHLIGSAAWLGTLLIYGGFLAVHALAGVLRPLFKKRGEAAAASELRRHHVLLLGTFYARNWCIAHLTPLGQASNIASVTAVVDGPTEAIPGVRYAPLPPWMLRCFGRTLTKLFVALREAIRRPPDLAMGYHLVPCGMIALLIARIFGARSAYQVTGGAIQLVGGGWKTENVLLGRLSRPSKTLEGLAVRVSNKFDLLVVRGSRARRELLAMGLQGRIRTVVASLRPEQFEPFPGERPIDVMCVNRLVEVKQPEHAVRVMAAVAQRIPQMHAAILGQGPLRGDLETLAVTLGASNRIEFAGHVENVTERLRRAKVFLLTSRTEGLSIAMVEAMAAGAVPVVADVGELGDLVINGQTGWRVTPGDIEGYTERIVELLRDPETLQRMSAAARQRAIEYNSLEAITQRWERVLDEICGDEEAPTVRRRPHRWRPRLLGSGLRRKLWLRAPRRAKTLVRPLGRLLPPPVWLGGDFRERSRFIEQAQWWPAERLRAWQLERIREICRLANERTAWYHRSFAEAGFDPRDLKSLDDLAAVPTIDSSVVRAHADELKTPEAAFADRVTTGGTGGRPLALWIDRDRSAVEYAHLVASWRRCGYRPEVPLAEFRGEVVEPRRDGLRHMYDPILRRHKYSNFHMTPEKIRRYLEHLATIGPCYLHVYPSSAVALARYLLNSDARRPENVLGILAGSENIFDADRELVERAFRMRMFTWYGHSEKTALAAECEYSRRYHAWPTYGYVELLDERGRPIREPGRQGEIAGTGFVNTVMPFIRYRTGDYATYVGERCDACGRSHLVIENITSHRELGTLVAADGALITWTALNVHDDTFDGVQQYQFRQELPGEARLRLVPFNGFDERRRQVLLERLNRKLDGRLRLTLELTDSIPKSPRGKSVYVDQQLKLSV